MIPSFAASCGRTFQRQVSTVSAIFLALALEASALADAQADNAARFWLGVESGAIVARMNSQPVQTTSDAPPQIVPSSESGLSVAAISFDGERQYLEFDNLDLPKSFTICALIKPADNREKDSGKETYGRQKISSLLTNRNPQKSPSGLSVFLNNQFGRGSDGSLTVSSGDKVSPMAADTRGNAVPLDKWTWIAIVANGETGTVEIYRDEARPGLRKSGFNPLFRNTGPFRIGAYLDNRNFFKGQIARMAIYPGALAEERIHALCRLP
jgi:hypothetical protein